jgi:hypothetical protein
MSWWERTARGPDDRPGQRWHVALSFAAAQRDYIGQVAKALQARVVRWCYDADEQIDLWGKYLPRNCRPSMASRQRWWWPR